MVIVNKEDLNWRNFTNALLVTEVCDEKKTIPFFFFLQIISVYSMSLHKYVNVLEILQ